MLINKLEYNDNSEETEIKIYQILSYRKIIDTCYLCRNAVAESCRRGFLVTKRQKAQTFALVLYPEPRLSLACDKPEGSPDQPGGPSLVPR